MKIQKGENVMKNIKNLKVNLKKGLPLLLASTIITTFSGCSFKDQKDPYYLKYYDRSNGGLDKGDKAGYVQEVKKDYGGKNLVDADNPIMLVSGYDSISEPFYLKYYDGSHGGADFGDGAGYVHEIEYNNGYKELVDANNFLVLLSDYSSIGEPYYLKYYDSSYGGPDIGGGAGYVQQITKSNGYRELVDANNFKVILNDYDYFFKPYYLESYDSKYGGLDDGPGAGYVLEITKDGKKYIVDANDFTILLDPESNSISKSDMFVK